MIIQKSCRNLLAFPEPLCTCCVVGNMATIATILWNRLFPTGRYCILATKKRAAIRNPNDLRVDCEWSREELENILWKWRIV
jgi:hypothetical protein